MCHSCGMAHQRLDTAKAFGQREYFEAAHHLSNISIATLKLERNHATETTHLPFGKFVIGMRNQPRIVYLLHSWMLGEVPGNRLCILLVLAHAYREGLNATQG